MLVSVSNDSLWFERPGLRPAGRPEHHSLVAPRDDELSERLLRRIGVVPHVELVRATAHRMEAESRVAGFIAFDRAERLALKVELDIADAVHANMGIRDEVGGLEVEARCIVGRVRADEIEAIVSARIELVLVLRENRLPVRPRRDGKGDILRRPPPRSPRVAPPLVPGRRPASSIDRQPRRPASKVYSSSLLFLLELATTSLLATGAPAHSRSGVHCGRSMRSFAARQGAPRLLPHACSRTARHHRHIPGRIEAWRTGTDRL